MIYCGRVWNSSGVVPYHFEIIENWRSRHDYFECANTGTKYYLSYCFNRGNHLIAGVLSPRSQIKIKTSRDTKRHSDVWKKSGIFKRVCRFLFPEKSLSDRYQITPHLKMITQLSAKISIYISQHNKGRNGGVYGKEVYRFGEMAQRVVPYAIFRGQACLDIPL